MSTIIPVDEIIVGETRERKPDWLRVKMPSGENYQRLKKLMQAKNLHTVCEEAMCPNLGHCWGRGTATFLLLGDICTRSCGFCHIKTGRPMWLDEGEPERVADAVARMALRHAVLTSVNRDELPDGGAFIFARSIELIHQRVPGCSVEVLIPDFKGDRAALKLVMDAQPEILNHNIETVPRETAAVIHDRESTETWIGPSLLNRSLSRQGNVSWDHAGIVRAFPAHVGQFQIPVSC